MAKKDPQPPARVEAALDTFEKELGGREALHSHLSFITPNPKIDYVIGLIADPRNDTKTLAKICAMGNISIGELFDYYKQAKAIRAQLAAMDAVYAEAPKLAKEIVRDAMAEEVDCAKCDGFGYTTVDKKATDCRKCKGKGKVLEKAPIERVKMAAEMMGIYNRNQPIAQVTIDNSKTQINQSQTNILGAGDLKAFREASDKIIYNQPQAAKALPEDSTSELDIVEGEVAPTAEKSNVPS